MPLLRDCPTCKISTYKSKLLCLGSYTVTHAALETYYSEQSSFMRSLPFWNLAAQRIVEDLRDAS